MPSRALKSKTSYIEDLLAKALKPLSRDWPSVTRSGSKVQILLGESAKAFGSSLGLRKAKRKLKRLGGLRLVGVFLIGIDLELFEHAAPQGVFGQHVLHGLF